MRVKHGCRSETRAHAGRNRVCTTYHANFQSRSGLLAHLADGKRPRCRNDILSKNIPKLFVLGWMVWTDNVGERLDGHTHAIAVTPDVRSDERVIGRVQVLHYA